MSSHAELVVRREGPVAYLAFNRPAKRNAVNDALIEALRRVLLRYSGRRQSRGALGQWRPLLRRARPQRAGAARAAAGDAPLAQLALR